MKHTEMCNRIVKMFIHLQSDNHTKQKQKCANELPVELIKAKSYENFALKRMPITLLYFVLGLPSHCSIFFIKSVNAKGLRTL